MKKFMKKNGVWMFSFAVVMYFCTHAFAQVTLPAGPDSGALLSVVFANGAPLLKGAAAVLLLCLGINTYLLPKLNLKSDVMPYVSLALGIVYAFASHVYGGETPSAAALALLSGPLASQMWDVLVTHVVAGVAKDVSKAPPVA